MKMIIFSEHLATCHCLKYEHGLIKTKKHPLKHFTQDCYAQSKFQSREFSIYPFSPLEQDAF